MVQKKKKNNNRPQITSNSSAVDGFNSMFSMFESNPNEFNEKNENKIEALIHIPQNNDLEKLDTNESKPKNPPKKPKRKLMIDQPNSTNITTTTNNDEIPSPTTNNTIKNDNNEISKILDFKKKELENRELDIIVKEKEIKRQKKDVKEEMDKMKVALNKQKVLLDQNKNSTVSIAIPSNALCGIQSEEMKTYIIEMISRQVTMNKIDEIIVFKTDDYNEEDSQQQSDLNLLLKVLEYIETPHYLREELFNTLDKDYFNVDKLNSINSCQQQQLTEEKEELYREGVVTNQNWRNQSIVNVGLDKMVLIPKRLNPGTRLTVDIKSVENNDQDKDEQQTYREKNDQYINGKIISPSDIKKEGYYWGHHIRLVDSLAKVASTCQYKDTENYDYIIMHSQYGEQFPSYTDVVINNAKKYNHLLVIFADANASSTVNPEFKLGSEILVPDTHINTLVDFNIKKLRFEETLSITLSKLKSTFYY
ncbi:hypothetical protein RB653_000271 [Dictyostelium firmibasis]|uniref:Uncharacterized protein n=1 Tax=Dictyostelium firmibasis TaxID=79012 RepID=A0AAN7U2Z9_9MYCE